MTSKPGSRPTAGQEEVRAIVTRYLKDQCSEGTRPNLALVRELLSSNHVIKSDVVTGRCLSRSFATSYLDWLLHHGTWRVLSYQDAQVEVNHFEYDRPDLVAPSPAYLGGVKWPSTMASLLKLGRGGTLESNGWDLAWFPESEFLTVCNGGNHRTLAHMLWGRKNVTPSKLKFYEQQSADLELNETLLRIEDLRRGRFEFAEYSLEEASRIKEFGLETSDEEWMLLKAQPRTRERRGQLRDIVALIKLRELAR